MNTRKRRKKNRRRRQRLWFTRVGAYKRLMNRRMLSRLRELVGPSDIVRPEHADAVCAIIADEVGRFECDLWRAGL